MIYLLVFAHLCDESRVWWALTLHAAGPVTLGFGVLSVFHGGAARTSLQFVLHFTARRDNIEELKQAPSNFRICKAKHVYTSRWRLLPFIYLGDMWFWDSVLQSFPTGLVIRSVFGSQLLTSPRAGPLSSVSGSWIKRRRDGKVNHTNVK